VAYFRGLLVLVSIRGVQIQQSVNASEHFSFKQIDELRLSCVCINHFKNDHVGCLIVQMIIRNTGIPWCIYYIQPPAARVVSTVAGLSFGRTTYLDVFFTRLDRLGQG
jgi:hypothetical protein